MSALALPENCIDAYLAHVIQGVSLGELARKHGGHRSTYLRRVRRVEELRDHPDWDAVIASLATHCGARGGAGVAVTRDTVCAAFFMTLTELHRAFEPAAALLTRLDHYCIIGAMPKAAIVGPDGPVRSIAREVALAALAMGWIMPRGTPRGKARQFDATAAIVECFGSPSSTQDEPRGLPPIRRNPTHYSSRRGPVEALMARKDQGSLTSDHLALAQEFHEIYMMRETAMAMAFDQISHALPPRTMEILTKVCGRHIGLEQVEREMGLPSRSAKAVISFALDAYGYARGKV